MKTIKERRKARVLELITDRFGGNKAAFAKAIGRPAPNVHRMLAEPSGAAKDARGIGEELARDIENLLGLRPLWLDEFDHNDQATIEPNTEQYSDALNFVRSMYSKDDKPIDPRHYGMIPLISWVQAGGFCSAPDLLAPGDAIEWVPALRKFGKHTYALRVNGDSMVSPYPGQKSYPPGTIIYVDPDKAITNGCRVVVRIHDQQDATFKVYSEDAGVRYLKPLNTQYRTMEMTPEMTICGVVVGSWIEE